SSNQRYFFCWLRLSSWQPLHHFSGVANDRLNIQRQHEGETAALRDADPAYDRYGSSDGLIMSFTRPILFWIAMLAAVIAVVALLREVLLPFVAGMVLAYLLDPVANRIERLGMNRLVATLVIIVVVSTAIALLIALIVPIIISELAYFIESFPQYLRRLQSLTTDPTRPWLSKLVGEGLSEAERSLGELTTLASSWIGTFLRSIWSGGRALLSIFSLAVVTPIVAFYLVYDWNRMIAVIDNWVPPARRDTVRALAREVDDTISGFVRGQSALCLVLAVYYALALWLIGLKHGLVIGFAAGGVSFFPSFCSLSRVCFFSCLTVRALAREVDDTISGFVRGQSALCLVLAVYYALALWLIGLKHGLVIGFAAGLISFIPYLGSLSGLVISTCVAIAQFWPDWTWI